MSGSISSTIGIRLQAAEEREMPGAARYGPNAPPPIE